jgi:predicted MFS family arabinose efflux permease
MSWFGAKRIPPYGRDVWLLGSATALLAGAYLGMMQLLKVLYILRLGFGPEFLGTVFATGALSFMLASMPAGALGARLGPTRVIVMGAVVNVAGMALLPFTEAVPIGLRTFWPLLVQIVASSGWSMVMVNQVPALMAFTTADTRGGAYALREALAGLGMFLCTLLGGMLPGIFAGLTGFTTEEPTPYRLGLWVVVGLGLISIVPLFWVRQVEAYRPTRTERRQRPPLLPLAVLVASGFLNNGATASCKVFASAYMDRAFGLPASLIGTVSSIGMLLAVAAALSGPRLARRRGSSYAMVIASSLLALSLVQMGLMGHWLAVGVGTAAMFALTALWVPAYQVQQMEMVAPQWRSLVAGAGAVGMSLGYGTVSFSGGYIVAGLGYRPLFLIGAAMALASAILVALLRRRGVAAAAQGSVEAGPIPASGSGRGADAHAPADG